MKKNLIVLQDGIKECGSAALLSIIRYYGGDISINHLLELTKTDKDGTNFYNMMLAGREIGLGVKGYKFEEKEKIINFCTPFICQLINNHYTHFVVVYKINKNRVVLMDPAKGKIIMKISEFFKLWTGYILIIKPTKKLPIYKQDNYLNNIIKTVIFDNKKTIINIILLSIIFTIVTCIYSFYFQILIDKILNTSVSNLIIVSIVFLIIIIIKIITNFCRNQLLIYLNQKIDLSLFTYTFKKIILLPYNYYKNKTTGEVISRINDLSYVKSLLSKIIITVFLDFLICLVGGLILYLINNKMFFIVLIIVILYLIILYIFRPIIKNMTNLNQENNAIVNSFLVETIGGFETIKGLNIENKVINNMKKKYISALNNVLNFDIVCNLEMFLKDLIESIGLLIIIFIGSKQVMEGNLSIGNLITFNSLLVYFLDPIRNILDLNKEYHYAVNSLKRINNLLEIDNEKLKSNGLEITGNIELKNVDFKFNEDLKILDNVNLRVKAKEKVLILGPSGSGKSTLLKLIYRYYDLPRNNIIINDLDILDYSLGDIRKNICYISQSETLYTDSIKNNILLDRNININEFYSVCKLTYVDDIIKNTFLGYDTILEENGVNISGGQRQRIVLARSLLKESKILMIDEGLNEIDINLERKILKNIFEKYYDKTIIVVSHRMDNIDLYDKVVNIDKGKIVKVITKDGSDNGCLIM